MWRDLSFGVRHMRRQPGFAGAAIAILALGIASTTSIFSVTFSVLLRGLPYEQPERLVAVSTARARTSVQRSDAGVADYFDWRQRQQVFEDLALTRPIANFNRSAARQRDTRMARLTHRSGQRPEGLAAGMSP